jgi:hypothetical protein
VTTAINPSPGVTPPADIAHMTITTAQINPYPGDAPPVVVERHALPPVPAATGKEFYERDVYATVTVGEIRAEVLRFLYWDPRDKATRVDVVFEVRIDGDDLPETCGFSQVCAYDSNTLSRLAAVCQAAGALLDEVTR